MASHGTTLLRYSVGLIFLWFGMLKLFPGMSPAEGLIKGSMPFLPMKFFIPFLALWEMAIGVGFIRNRHIRFTILIMFLQMIGAASPLVINPTAAFVSFPFILTMEGQYIIKNLVLITAAIVIGGTVRNNKPQRI